jgi:hypothetical protein
MKPQTRRSGLLIRELPDELLVYDQEQHRAHCLNRTAALVFQQADGTRTLDELARVLDPAAAAGPDAVSAVTLAVAQLAAAGLLEGSLLPDGPATSLSRRDVARRFGIAAAILLPAVATLVAPTPAEAAATCVQSCAGQLNGTQCTCTGETTCTLFCVSGLCDGVGPC